MARKRSSRTKKRYSRKSVVSKKKNIQENLNLNLKNIFKEKRGEI